MKKALQLVLMLGVTGLFTWLAFRGTRWDRLGESLKSAHYRWLIPYLMLLLLAHVFRVLRWGNLLSGMEKIPFRQLNEASSIGFMMLLVMPFRLGEFARPFLIAQRSQIRRSSAMTTIVLERIADGLTIAVLLRALLFFLPGYTDTVRYVRWGANMMFVVFGGGLAFLIFARKYQPLTARMVQKFIRPLSTSTADKVSSITHHFVEALRQLPAAPQRISFTAYTVGYWGCYGVGGAVLSNAFACTGTGPETCGGFHLSLYQAFLVQCILVVGLMIPGAPGMVGTFQAAVKMGLSLFVPETVVNSQGMAFANVMWLTQAVQQVGLGLLFIVVSHGSFRDIAGHLNEREQKKEPPDVHPEARNSGLKAGL